MFEGCEVVKEGTALYAGTSPYSVKIAKSPVWYGSGDYEDPPEICEDREIECYEVWYSSPGDGKFTSGGGVFATLDEATKAVEQATNGTIHWQ